MGPPLLVKIAAFFLLFVLVTCNEDLTKKKIHTEQAARSLAASLKSLIPSFAESTLQNIDFSDENVITSFRDHLESNILNIADSNSTSCSQDIFQLMMDVIARESYALQVVDAFGKIPSGVSKLNLAWVGSYDLCRSITAYHTNTTDVKFEGKYCVASVSNAIFPKQMQALPLGFSLGICVPKSCQEKDLNPLYRDSLEFLLEKLHLNQSIINKTIETSGITCPGPAPWSTGDAVALSLVGLILLLTLIGTGFDIYKRMLKAHPQHTDKVYVVNSLIQERPNPESLIENEIPPDVTAQGPLDTREISRSKKDTFKEFMDSALMSFSFIHNGEKLLNAKVREGTLGAVNGIRVLSMWWVILGHTYVFTVYLLNNMLDLVNVLKRFSFQAISNATYSVDSFFFLSGLLLAYLLLRELKRNSGKTNWLLLYVHRFWRLTPTYMFVMMFYTTLYLHVPEGPFMRAGDSGAGPCIKYWWSNLLYINNFVPPELAKECMGWAWYLANDMQFFVLSPPIIYLLFRNRYAGLGVISALLLVCLTSTGVVARERELTTNILDPRAGNAFSDIYVKPWFRIAPYLVGITCGYCIHVWENNGRPRLYKIVVVVGWCLAIAINMSVLYGLYGQAQSGISWSPDVSALYIATSRFAWSLGLAWVTFACITGYGGPINTILAWNAWAPLGRLTYCAYLIHPMVIFNYVFSRRSFIHYTDYNMIYFYIGHIVLSYMVAFVVSVLVEAPTLALEKIIFKRKRD